MSLLDRIPIWQRHFAVEQAMGSFYGLQLQFPVAARMVSSGEINQRVLPPIQSDAGADLGKLFEGLFNLEPLSPEHEAENEAWRTLVHAIGSIIAQIYFLSRDRAEEGSMGSPAQRELRAHGDRAIALIVGRSWRSIGRFVPYLFSDPDLETMVNNLVENQISTEQQLERLVTKNENEEVTNA